MKLDTARFGEIEIDDAAVITFEKGIPAFEDLQRFVLVQENQETPFAYMQSIDDGEISFVIVNPFLFFPDYEFDLSDSDQVELQIESEQDVHVWVLMNVANSLDTATLNLVAPIVFNFTKRLGKQVILHNSSYQTKHFLNSDRD